MPISARPLRCCRSAAPGLSLPVCAVLGGLSGGLFSRIVVMFARGLPGLAGRLIAKHPIAFAMLCGLGVA